MGATTSGTTWQQHNYNTDESHEYLYACAAGFTLVVFLVYVANGSHRQASGNLVVNRVFCDLVYFTSMAVAFEIPIGTQAWHNGNETMIFSNCIFTAPVPLFFRLGQVLWFIVQIWDINKAIRTPFVFRNAAGVRRRYALWVWGICSVATIIAFFPPNDGYWKVGRAWGVNMEGDCGYNVWEDPFSPWTIVTQIAPDAFAAIVSIWVTHKARKYLLSGCRRTRVIRNRTLGRLTVQVVSWCIYYSIGTCLLTASSAVWAAQGDKPWEYVFGNTGKNMAIAVISWRASRGILINPFLLLVDIGMFDGLIVKDPDSDKTSGQIACEALEDTWANIKHCRCGQSTQELVLKSGTEEHEAQLAAREDVMVCVMKGVIQSTQKTAAALAKKYPDEAAVAAAEDAYEASPGSGEPNRRISAELMEARDEIMRVEAGQQNADAMLKIQAQLRDSTQETAEDNPVELSNLGSSRAFNLSAKGSMIAQEEEDKSGAKQAHEYEGSLFWENCPLVYHYIRFQLGITAADFISSLQADDGTINQMAEKFTEGRSNSFFYFTLDRKYMVKTCTKGDYEAISENTCQYALYLENNPDSLINRIVGCYQLQFHAQEDPIYVIILINIMWSPEFHKPEPLFRFDLKGSSIDRRSLPKDLAKLDEWRREGFAAQLKDTDIDLLDLKLCMEPETLDRFCSLLEKDIEWLRLCEIMDYSLLLCVCPVSEAHTDREASVGADMMSGDMRFSCHYHGGLKGTIFGNVPVILYIGVIDISQKYDFSKRGERFLKTKCLCKDPDISCCPVDPFAERFVRKIEGYFGADRSPAGDHIGVQMAMTELEGQQSAGWFRGHAIDAASRGAGSAEPAEVPARGGFLTIPQLGAQGDRGPAAEKGSETRGSALAHDQTSHAAGGSALAQDGKNSAAGDDEDYNVAVQSTDAGGCSPRSCCGPSQI